MLVPDPFLTLLQALLIEGAYVEPGLEWMYYFRFNVLKVSSLFCVGRSCVLCVALC